MACPVRSRLRRFAGCLNSLVEIGATAGQLSAEPRASRLSICSRGKRPAQAAAPRIYPGGLYLACPIALGMSLFATRCPQTQAYRRRPAGWGCQRFRIGPFNSRASRMNAGVGIPPELWVIIRNIFFFESFPP